MARRVTSKDTELTAGAAAAPADVFDVRKVRRLVELMNEYDLSEIDLRQADQRVRLRRGPETIAMSASPAVGLPSSAAHAAGAGAGAAAGGAAGAGESKPVDDSKFTFVRSPMVGTFYATPNPDSAPFVKVGDQVGPESTVCVIEAMKVFNEIPAECSGKIVAVLVENGEPVEFSQPLFRVEPNS